MFFSLGVLRRFDQSDQTLSVSWASKKASPAMVQYGLGNMGVSKNTGQLVRMMFEVKPSGSHLETHLPGTWTVQEHGQVQENPRIGQVYYQQFVCCCFFRRRQGSSPNFQVDLDRFKQGHLFQIDLDTDLKNNTLFNLDLDRFKRGRASEALSTCGKGTAPFFSVAPPSPPPARIAPPANAQERWPLGTNFARGMGRDGFVLAA